MAYFNSLWPDSVRNFRILSLALAKAPINLWAGHDGNRVLIPCRSTSGFWLPQDTAGKVMFWANSFDSQLRLTLG